MAEFNDLKVKQISDIIVLHMLGIFFSDAVRDVTAALSSKEKVLLS